MKSQAFFFSLKELYFLFFIFYFFIMLDTSHIKKKKDTFSENSIFPSMILGGPPQKSEAGLHPYLDGSYPVGHFSGDKKNPQGELKDEF